MSRLNIVFTIEDPERLQRIGGSRPELITPVLYYGTLQFKEAEMVVRGTTQYRAGVQFNIEYPDVESVEPFEGEPYRTWLGPRDKVPPVKVRFLQGEEGYSIIIKARVMRNDGYSNANDNLLKVLQAHVYGRE